jgi:hypothetical protein
MRIVHRFARERLSEAAEGVAGRIRIVLIDTEFAPIVSLLLVGPRASVACELVAAVELYGLP